MNIKVAGWAWLDRASLTPLQLANLKVQLTVKPRVTYVSADQPHKDPIQLFQDEPEEGRFGAPRAFVAKVAKVQHEFDDRTSDGFPICPTTTWCAEGPFAEQEVAAQVVVNRLKPYPYGAILQAGCGFGKTASALEIARRLGRTTLVIVHKLFLLKQWKKRIKQFWPEAKIGHVQQDVCKFEGCDIVVAMLDSLEVRTYTPELYRYFGTILVDEVHRTGAASWANVIPQFHAKTRLGLTATPRRKDGAENVFFWHIGPIAYVAKSEQMPFKVRRVFTAWEPGRDAPDAIVLTMMCKDASRTRQIVDELVQAVDAGRKTLVLGERLFLLESIKLELENRRPGATIGIHCGDWYESTADRLPSDMKKLGRKERKMRHVSEEEEEAAEKCQVIFATKQKVEEGLDIWDIDTLFLVTPLSDVEQACGRARRFPPPKWTGKPKNPVVVVDFVDGGEMCKRKYRSRMEYYRANGLFPAATV